MLMLSRTSGVIATRIHQYGVAALSTSDCRFSSAVMGYLSPASAALAKAPPVNPLHNTVVLVSIHYFAFILQGCPEIVCPWAKSLLNAK